MSECATCGGVGYVNHANKEPLMSEHYREMSVPCPDCSRQPRVVWHYRPGELAAFRAAIMNRDVTELQTLIADAIVHGAEPQAVTEHVVDVLRDDASLPTKQWWSEHGHEANGPVERMCPQCRDWLDDEDYPVGDDVCIMCAKGSSP